MNSAPVQRTLFLALDAWADDGTPSPASRVPRLDDGTLVLPANTGFPTDIPDKGGLAPSGKVTYIGLKTSRYQFDFGPGFYDDSNPATFGIPTIFPPLITPPLMPLMTDAAVPIMLANGPVYPSFVPKTDKDGNDIAGVRLPDVTVPLATHTGWALRSGPQANDGCESTGQYIPFPKTEDERKASGDPRRSVEERYPSFDKYLNHVEHAVDDLVEDRLMLCEDAYDQIDRLVQAGLAAGVPPPDGDAPQSALRHCKPPKAKGGKK